MPRRFRINGPLLAGFAVFVGGICLYVAYPFLVEGEVDAGVEAPLAQEVIRERGVTCVTGLWFFVFGATIGSFLNVVAYRMPMGLSFVAKPSRCPYCERPILFKHNVPIFGWLALGGRCHACRLPISVRYPLVEIIVGALYFILFFCELASGGRNLPMEVTHARPGIMWNVLAPNWPLIGLFFFHAFLVGVLATIALIKYDRLRIPRRLVLFTISVAVALRFFFSTLNVVPWWSPFESPMMLPAHRILGLSVDVLVGLLVGWTIHGVIEPQRMTRSPSSVSGAPAIGALLGAFLGWQMVVPVSILAMIFQFFTMIAARVIQGRCEVLWAASFLWATVVSICLWRFQAALGLPSDSSFPIAHWSYLVACLGGMYVTAKLSATDNSTLASP